MGKLKSGQFLVPELRRLGIKVQSAHGRLSFSPAELLTEELRERIIKHKRQIFAFLAAENRPFPMWTLINMFCYSRGAQLQACKRYLFREGETTDEECRRVLLTRANELLEAMPGHALLSTVTFLQSVEHYSGVPLQ